MPGVFSLLGIGGDAANEPGQKPPGGGGLSAGAPKGPGKAELPVPGNAAAGGAAAGGGAAAAPGGLRPCDGCGEMRKTTQGLCAACFLTGGATRKPEPRATEKGGPVGRLPGIQNQSMNGGGFGAASAAPSAAPRAAQPLTLGRPKAGGDPLKKSASAADVGGAAPGAKPNLGAMLANAAKDKKNEREDPHKTTFSAAQPSTASKSAAHIAASSQSGGGQGGQGAAARGPTSYRDAKERASAKARAELSPEPLGESRSRVDRTDSDPTPGGATAAGAPSRGLRNMSRCITLTPSTQLAVAPELPGGFRRGDTVLSLISRMRHSSQILEFGNEGTVVGVLEGPTASDKDTKLLIQFKLGFDWTLAPHQVCHQAQYHALTAAGLPGGFKWGDRVQSLETRLQPKGAKRGLNLGDIGTVIGPGCTGSKIGIRFDTDSVEWSLWPAAVCKAEVYEATVAAKLPGGFRRGDRVKTKGLRVIPNGDGEKGKVEDGHEGVVVGPGHVPGRLLVCFDGSNASWSVEPTVISLHGSKAET